MIPSLDMLQQYAPDVAPQTIAAIIRVESGGNQFAVGVNGPVKLRRRPRTAVQAVAAARYFISKGFSVDLGLMQINSRNLSGLGLTVEQAFDARCNIQAGAKILARAYRGAIKRYGPGQLALRAALSAYNTGNYERGFKNGYVAKYFHRVSGGSIRVACKKSLARNMAVSIDKKASVLAKGVNPCKTELSVDRQNEQELPRAFDVVSQPSVTSVADNF